MTKIKTLHFIKREWRERYTEISKLINDIMSCKYMKKTDIAREDSVIPEAVKDKDLASGTEIRLPVINPAISKEGYTGIVCISLNFGGNTNTAEAAKKKIRLLPQVICSFIGLSGRSLVVLIRFTNEEGTLPESEKDITLFHAAAYQSAASLLTQLTGLKAKGELGNWKNGIFLSYDKDMYINENAIAIPIPQPNELPNSLTIETEEIHAEEKITAFPNHTQIEMDVMQFNMVCRKLRFEKEKDNGDFVIALANECRKAGIDCEVAIRCAMRMNWLQGKEMLIRTSFENAYEEKPFGRKQLMSRNVINQHLLRQFLDRRYVFRRNIITGSSEYVERNRFITSWRPVNQLTINTICMAAQEAGIEAWRVDVERYVNSDRISEWDPIRTWLMELPKWDGTDRISSLANTIKTTNEHWNHDFAVWLRSMVNQWMGRGGMYGSSMVLMLIGGQGTGKSTFCKRIMPQELMEYYNDRIDFSSKREAERALIRFGLICMDEFDQITPSQNAYLKHVLQKSDVKWRKMYQDDIEQKQRYATFCATTNSYSPLNDPSGSRRYLCTEILERIDITQPIDYKQLYAQLVYEIRHGEQCYFTAEDEHRIQNINGRFQQEIPLQTMLLSYYRKAEEDETAEELTSAEILERLKKIFKNLKCDISTANKLGKILTSNQFTRKRVNRGWVYLIKKI